MTVVALNKCRDIPVLFKVNAKAHFLENEFDFKLKEFIFINLNRESCIRSMQSQLEILDNLLNI